MEDSDKRLDTGMLKLIQELRAHQVELEKQNEDLRHLWAQTEIVNDKYTGLYDFTPTGYFILSRDGKIIELNLSGARLLNNDRFNLKNNRFRLFIADNSKPNFDLFLNNLFKNKTKKSCEVNLSINGNTPLFVRLTGILSENDEQCFVTMVDITNLREAESQRDQQLLFSTALNKIAEVIISQISSEEILQNTNRIIGETLQLDRSLIYDISFEENRITALCEWLKEEHPDIAATKNQYPVDMFLSPFTEIKNRQKYLESHYNAVGECFAADESGRILHEHFKIKSLIWYPFAFYENGYYLFTLNQILEDRCWKPEEFAFIDSVANQVSLALMKIKMLEDRDRSNAELQETLVELKKSQKIAQLGNWKLDLSSRVFTASEEGLRIFGFPLNSEPKFQEVSDCIHPDDQGYASQMLKNALLTGEPYTFEMQIIRKDSGTIRNIVSHGEIQHDFNGVACAVFGTNQDITDRRRAGETLKESEEKFRLIAENTGDTIAVLDLNLNFTYLSPSVENVLGYTQAEAINLKIDQILTPASLNKVHEVLQEHLPKVMAEGPLNGTYPTLELEEIHKGGSSVWVELTFSFLRDDSNKPTGIVTISRNITSRKLVEQAL